jgi:hypothetical protein
MQGCYICGAEMAPLFTLKVLHKYDVGYFCCRACGYVRTEHPYWLDESYASAIAATDTGIMQRNLSFAARLSCILFFCLRSKGPFVDVAGGYGILTRLMRDSGFDYFWDDKYCPNLVARGFEASNVAPPFAAMSGFEVIEHSVNPVQFVEENVERYRCATLIFSTETYADDAGPSRDWWYLSAETGQHVSFFHKRTLAKLAERLKLRFYSSHGLHIFTKEPLSAAVLNLVTGRPARPLATLIRKVKPSRVWADHVALAAPKKNARH